MNESPPRPCVSAQQVTRIVWVILFGIAMAFTEACVVVYIRGMFDAIKSPANLDLRVVGWFVSKHPWMIVTEQFREVSTIAMLIAIAMLSGRTARERWGIFLLAFGTWDIWYYVWLYALIRWPPSLLTTDVLFLIPHPWIGPVLAPPVVAVEMILVGGWLMLATPLRLSRSSDTHRD